VVFAQFRPPGAAGPGGRPRMEYLHREVETDGITDKLDDLSRDGWMVFQVVPIWTLEKEGDDTKLIPRSYQVFARRFVPGPPGEGAEVKKKFGEFWKKEFFKKEFFKKEFEKRKKEEVEKRKNEELEKRKYDFEKKEAPEPEDTKDEPDRKDEA